MGDLRGEATTLYNVSNLERDRDNLSEALTNIDAAIELVEQIRSNVVSQELKTSFLATVEDFYKFKIDLLMQLHQQNPEQNYDKLAFETSERGKARSLLDLLTETNIDIRHGVDYKLVSQERRLRWRLDNIEERRVDLCSKGCQPEKLNKLETEREQLLDEYRQLQAQIRAASPEYAELTQPEPLDLPEVQKLLDEDTVLLQYSLGADRSYVWAISQDDFIAQELASSKQITKIARQLHQASENAYSDRPPEPLAKQLSQLILEPIGDRLDKKRLVIVGDGVLHYIPFTSLPLASEATKDNLLIDTHQIVNLPSSSVLERLRQDRQQRQPAPKEIVVFADPVFKQDDSRLKEKPELPTSTATIAFNPFSPNRAARSIDLSLNRLPGTRREAEAIFPLFPQDKSTQAYDFDASRDLAISADIREYNIVHFATHGIVNSDRPELSGIILSLFDERGKAENGFLRLHDVFNLNLNADLVVLSACETGLGQEIKGEGLVGLTRGFMYAGANKVLVSLWNVDDDATAEMMTQFYKFMLKDNLSPAESLRKAQQTIRTQAKWQHPKYWAAFTLQGDW